MGFYSDKPLTISESNSITNIVRPKGSNKVKSSKKLFERTELYKNIEDVIKEEEEIKNYYYNKGNKKFGEYYSLHNDIKKNNTVFILGHGRHTNEGFVIPQKNKIITYTRLGTPTFVNKTYELYGALDKQNRASKNNYLNLPSQIDKDHKIHIYNNKTVDGNDIFIDNNISFSFKISRDLLDLDQLKIQQSRQYDENIFSKMGIFMYNDIEKEFEGTYGDRRNLEKLKKKNL